MSGAGICWTRWGAGWRWTALRRCASCTTRWPAIRSPVGRTGRIGGEAGEAAEEPWPGAGPRFALPLRIEHDGRVLSFLSSISTFNTPMDVTVAELAIETFLPADPATVKYLTVRSP